MRRPHPLRALSRILEEIEVGIDAKVSNIQVSVALRECGWLGVSGAGPDEDIRLLAHQLATEARNRYESDRTVAALEATVRRLARIPLDAAEQIEAAIDDGDLPAAIALLNSLPDQTVGNTPKDAA